MGFWLSPRLKALVDKPGYLGSDQAQELRNLYVDGTLVSCDPRFDSRGNSYALLESANQEPLLASDFAQLCYFGRVVSVRKATASLTVVSLSLTPLSCSGS
jgi:hypothetical protein